jgi:cyclopropane fatty-acyl-phospholipid synthase-like methyltransferase
MDDAAASRIAYGALALMNPMSDAATDEAIDLLDLAAGSRVLEVACGRAELLRRS